MRVLIIEDEVLVADLLTSIVDEAGGEVVAVVDTAEEALEVTRRRRPDLALVDIQLAGAMDGIAAARVLGEAGVLIVFVTGSNDPSTASRIRDLAPLGVCHKPFRNETLLTLLAQAARRLG